MAYSSSLLLEEVASSSLRTFLALRARVPIKEKLEAKALKVATIEPASAVLFYEWNRLWEPMEQADLSKGKDCLVLMAEVAGSWKEDFRKMLEVEVAMVEEEVGAGEGEVMGGGDDFGVSRSLLGEMPSEIMGEKVGE
ncbi:hypothetical protein Tco_0537963 [Tanacetum coccineum]